MSQSTKIEWATKVWNPVTGCNKVSQGCKNCYAETVAKRFWGKRKFTDVQMHEDRLQLPNWKTPQRVFVNSMSDLFHENVSFEFINKVWYVMYCNPKHVFMILTKRPDRMVEFINWRTMQQAENYVLPNVWLGVSVENQETANERIPVLLQVPAAVRWLSCEPLLGAVDLLSIKGKSPFNESYQVLEPVLNAGDSSRPAIDWVVVGGESGAKARPMHPDWVRSLRDQCQASNVPFFFKQWGALMPILKSEIKNYPLSKLKTFEGHHLAYAKVGKAKAGRMLDGVEHNEFPKL